MNTPLERKPSLHQRAIRFWGEGVECAGILSLPEAVSAGESYAKIANKPHDECFSRLEAQKMHTRSTLQSCSPLNVR